MRIKSEYPSWAMCAQRERVLDEPKNIAHLSERSHMKGSLGPFIEQFMSRPICKKAARNDFCNSVCISSLRKRVLSISFVMCTKLCHISTALTRHCLHDRPINVPYYLWFTLLDIMCIKGKCLTQWVWPFWCLYATTWGCLTWFILKTSIGNSWPSCKPASLKLTGCYSGTS